MEPLEVEADHAPQFSALEQDQELRLDSGVEVLLDQWCQVAVNLHMLELLEQLRRAFVVLLDGLDHGVPRR